MKKRILYAVIAAFALLNVCGCQRQKPAEPVAAEPVPVHEEITLLALGDNLLHMPVVNSGKQSDGTYHYAHLFEKLQPGIKNADIAVIGQETVFGGAALGYSGYPLFNSPSDMGKSLVEEGFDVVLHASNHVLDRGALGVENTLNFWEEYPAIQVLGIHASTEEQNSVNVQTVKGADIALLNYTYGTNGIPLPQGKEYLVDLIDEERIEADSKFAEENADFTIAFMHWGTEYSIKPNEMQKELAQKMCQWGVDLIIGSHPHVIEPVEWVTSENGNKCLVYYSLGNYVSRQLEERNILGGVADVTLLYDGEKVTIADSAFVPIVTHYDITYKKFSVYPLGEYTNELAAGHGIVPYVGKVSCEGWRDIVSTVFEGYDTSFVRYEFDD
ncbi:MAG: CapA family protein [Ruminococcaceae bacterium]|nr:CapA family protein [Oscillospiraceae bacterium]